MSAAVRSLRLATEGARRGRECRLDNVRLTGPQRRFVSDPRRLFLWRDGNRLGKSFAAAFEIVHRARGTHPWLETHRPPVRILVVSYSIEQMEPLQRELWGLLPKDEIDPRNGYDTGRGITGKPPRIVFTSGPGSGSVIQFATYKAGSKRVAGGAYHFIVCDEPPTETMYGELMPRISTTRGTFRICFTPTPESPPLEWLRELVKDGSVPEMNVGLAEANLWPEGSPRPLMYQHEIDEEVAKWLAVERAMREHGSWEPIVKGRWLLQFGPDNVREFSLRDLPRSATVAIGIDHGADAGKQAAMLLFVDAEDPLLPRVWWADEVVSEGYTTPADDAAAILTMLRRWGLQYSDVDDWVGDRPTGDGRYLAGKSNRDLRRQLSAQTGIDLADMERIHVPKKWDGSVMYGLRLINGLLGGRLPDGTPQGLIHPRCETFRRFCERFKGNSRDPLKDVGDAGRYPVERLVKHRGLVGGTVYHS